MLANNECLSSLESNKQYVFFLQCKLGAIQVLHNAMGQVEDIRISLDLLYKGTSSNVISVTRGWVGLKFAEKRRCVTLGWPLCVFFVLSCSAADTARLEVG